MTFEILHESIKDGCDCLNYGSQPNAVHVFYRRGKHAPAKLDDFLSHYELGYPVSGTTCKEHCHHRGVSVYHIKIDLARRKQELKAAAQFAPGKGDKIAYFIKIRPAAGLVWYQDGKDHCELLKADKFSLELIEFVDVFDTSIP